MIRFLLFAIAVLVAALCIQGARFAHARSGEIRSGFTADSLQAAHDTTRQFAFAQLHDSVTIFTRRAAQQAQRADALDRALQASRLATLNAQVRVSALDTVIRTRTVSAPRDSLHRSGFSVRQAPYTVAGEVVGDSTTRLDAISLRVDLDSLPLQLRLSCQAATDTPIKRALVVAIAPPWARVALGDIEQSPNVCNPELAPASTMTRLRRTLARAGLSVGAGVVVTGTGAFAIRPALLIGVRLWP
jgi:hypothetical protein